MSSTVTDVDREPGELERDGVDAGVSGRRGEDRVLVRQHVRRVERALEPHRQHAADGLVGDDPQPVEFAEDHEDRADDADGDGRRAGRP